MRFGALFTTGRCGGDSTNFVVIVQCRLHAKRRRYLEILYDRIFIISGLFLDTDSNLNKETSYDTKLVAKVSLKWLSTL